MTQTSWWRVDWRFPLIAAAVALFVFIPLLLSPFFDEAELFFVFLGVPAALLTLLILAAANRSISIFAMAVAVALVSCLVGLNSNEIRFNGRWLLWGHGYKKAVMVQHGREMGLPHAEWDGWGFAGNDTVVYVVFDPNDGLKSAAEHRLSGTVPGVPCGVSNVYRLEKHWYSVVMYTDTAWNDCRP